MATPTVAPEANFSTYEYEYIFEAENGISSIIISNSSINLITNSSTTTTSCYRSDGQELVDDSVQAVLISVYALTAALSLVGNLLVIAFQLTPGSTCARSALRQQLVSLAVADLILGVFCPAFAYSNFIQRKWIYPRWLCPVAQGAQLLAVFVNTTSLTLIGLDRYMATVWPFSRLHRFARAHAGRTRLTLVWLLGALYAAVPMRYMDIKPNNGVYQSPTVICHFNATTFNRRLFMNINFLLTFILPTIVITACYLAIARKIRTENQAIESAVHFGEEKTNLENHGNAKKEKPLRKRMKTMKLICALVLLHNCCWMPVKLYQYLLEYDLLKFCTEFTFNLFITTYIIFKWLSMANSFLNPLLYTFLSFSFQNDFKNVKSSFKKVSIRKSGEVKV